MVLGAAPALTKIGFRRDVKLFLAALVGFLVVLVLALVVVLTSLVSRMELAQSERFNAVADDVARHLSGLSAQDLQARLEQERREHALGAIEVGKARAGDPTVGAPSLQRVTTGGTVTLRFDDSDLAAARRLARTTIAICTAAAGVGLVLLFLYLPRIVQPIERMLDDARALGGSAAGVDEASYLVETFRNTIATMQQQAAELERLHERERVRANELELLTSTLTRSLSSGFIALDANGTLVDLNAAAREILGISGAASGKPIAEILPGTPFTELVARAFAERRTLSRVEIDQGDSMIGLSTVPLINDRGEFLGLMALFTDVTHIRRLEDRVRDQQALADLGEMSAGIAHEFRNALSTILGYLRLSRRQELPAEATARLAAAEQEAAFLAAAVDSLLKFARPMTLERDQVELRELIEPLVTRLGEQTPNVALRLSGERVTVHADATALRSCFENLLRNAVEAIGDRPGHVDVDVSRDGDAVVTIRDDGAGVDPAEVPRLFLPFQSDRPGGTGLGLPLARKIAILHGGSLAMTGAPGRGAAVTVRLPVLQKATTPASAPAQTNSA